MDDKTLAALRTAADELLYPSESDAPFEPFVWERVENTTAAVQRLAQLPRTTDCQQVSLDDFFGDLLEEKEFRSLRAAIESNLSQVKVYRCGSIKVMYLIVGTDSEGRLAGLKTNAVET